MADEQDVGNSWALAALAELQDFIRDGAFIESITESAMTIKCEVCGQSYVVRRDMGAERFIPELARLHKCESASGT